jgi:hypothetical protein
VEGQTFLKKTSGRLMKNSWQESDQRLTVDPSGNNILPRSQGIGNLLSDKISEARAPLLVVFAHLILEVVTLRQC